MVPVGLYAALVALFGLQANAELSQECPMVHHENDDATWGCGLSRLDERLSHDLSSRGSWANFSSEEIVQGKRCGFCDGVASDALSSLPLHGQIRWHGGLPSLGYQTEHVNLLRMGEILGQEAEISGNGVADCFNVHGRRRIHSNSLRLSCRLRRSCPALHLRAR
eukprot:scaffold1214_cov156-Pinguiococcus_pyrenoidosus.AAC.2